MNRLALPDAGPVTALLAVLNADGGEARIVGGAVRDLVLGLAPADYDLATTLPPQTVDKRVQAAGWKAVPTGIAHGTLTVVIDGRPFEVTTLREDIDTDGRHASVRFGTDWQADAARRDFTLNAMSLDADGRLYDTFGGADDARAGRVRFIGMAQARIREDYLRILRFFRFTARFGKGAPDAEGLAACTALQAGIDTLSKERLRAEMLKLLAVPDPLASLGPMRESGILARVLGQEPSLTALTALIAIERALTLPPDPVLRLALLTEPTREQALALRTALKLANAESRRVEGLAEAWQGADEPARKALLYATGPRNYRDRALAAFARSGAPADDADWHAAVSLPERWNAPAFPVSGDDLKARGYREGAELGQALAELKARWMAAGFPRGKAEALGLL